MMLDLQRRAGSSSLRPYCLPALWLLLLWSVSLWGCGADAAGPAGPDAGEPEAGVVVADNQTDWDVEIAWLQADSEGALIVRLSVASGHKETLGTWSGGTELGLDLVLLVPPETGPRIRRKATVVIDGDQMVLIRAGEDPFSAEVSVEPAAGRVAP